MNLENTTIGVWGIGAVGASVIRFLQRHHSVKICVMDKRIITHEEQKALATQNIRYFPQTAINEFFATVDYAIPSPGVNLRLYSEYKNRCLSEVDLFYTFWHKPSIVITGTLGKTTTTHALSHLLRSLNYRIAIGGNVGTTGMKCLLDLLEDQAASDYAVLELSSFQLEQSHHISSDIAIVTNIYQNHLDYHGTMENYFSAKWQCIIQQKKDTQHAIIPYVLLPKARALQPHRSFRIVSLAQPPASYIQEHDIVYFFDAHLGIIRRQGSQETILTPLQYVPDLSYRENWITIAAALDTCRLPATNLIKHVADLSLPDHRLQCIATINGIHFYNDSKSTITEAAVAAVNKIDSTAIILLLGGISKGVDRASHIPTLAPKVKHVVCFGQEAAALYQACLKANIAAQATPDLESAFNAALDYAKAGDHVIFSPAGASFDLFNSYNHRGDCFIALVTAYAQQHKSRT